jgi:hypothetical protein
MPEDPLASSTPSADDAARARRVNASRTLWFGVLLFVIASLLILAPLALGRGLLNKYLVAFGFIIGCLSLSCFVHGAWDWWRG